MRWCKDKIRGLRSIIGWEYPWLIVFFRINIINVIQRGWLMRTRLRPRKIPGHSIRFFCSHFFIFTLFLFLPYLCFSLLLPRLVLYTNRKISYINNTPSNTHPRFYTFICFVHSCSFIWIYYFFFLFLFFYFIILLPLFSFVFFFFFLYVLSFHFVCCAEL